jgi:hypothetical protein
MRQASEAASGMVVVGGGAEPVGRGSQGHSSRQEYRVGGGAAGLRQRAAKGVGHART